MQCNIYFKLLASRLLGVTLTLLCLCRSLFSDFTHIFIVSEGARGMFQEAKHRV